MSTPAPQYGVKTCGKRAETPFGELGPCLLEPGHDGKCRFKAPFMNGTVSVERLERLPQLEDHPWFSDEVVLKARRTARRLLWSSLAACGINVGLLVWNVLRLFEILP